MSGLDIREHHLGTVYWRSKQRTAGNGSVKGNIVGTALLQFGGIWLTLATVCWIVARYKNLNARVWFLRGLAFGAFALDFLLLEPGD
jgi:hypothetical protein